MITLRQFTEEDAETVCGKLCPGTGEDEARGLIREWNSGAFEGKPFQMYAVICEGRIAGSVSLYERSKSAVSVGIELLPEYRGAGCASEAMGRILEIAAQRGYRLAVDQVRADNAASIRLHEKLGFETDGYIYKNRNDRQVLLYYKAL